MGGWGCGNVWSWRPLESARCPKWPHVSMEKQMEAPRLHAHTLTALIALSLSHRKLFSNAEHRVSSLMKSLLLGFVNRNTPYNHVCNFDIDQPILINIRYWLKNAHKVNDLFNSYKPILWKVSHPGWPAAYLKL